ncbi:helix-turn-helix transcriptional regulator [uncultured Parasphingorhabdus sp.]|uniref:helix-turn-helix domain-containing protein n=1 Tax=uncultured Parasphingorhabdus sp. TaxID=2709694 RepID=UPI0030D76B61
MYIYTARLEKQLNKQGAIECWQLCQARKNKAHSEMLHHESFENAPVLTAREHEILEYIAQGLSTKEVAQHVGIAPRTVDKHVENIRLKLRAKNRTHMIACAVVEGLLEVEEDEREEPSGNEIPAPFNPSKE